MVEYTVYWKINDGMGGFPNIEAELSSGDYCNDKDHYCGAVTSYKKAVKTHFNKALELGKRQSEIKHIHEKDRGKTINGSRYRLFTVIYTAPDGGSDRIRNVKVLCRSVK